MILEKKRSTLPCVILSDEMGRTVESSSVNVLPAACALLIWYKQHEVVTNISYHQLADGPIHFGGVSNACLVDRIMELS